MMTMPLLTDVYTYNAKCIENLMTNKTECGLTNKHWLSYNYSQQKKQVYIVCLIYNIYVLALWYKNISGLLSSTAVCITVPHTIWAVHVFIFLFKLWDLH